jgi:hypothetical protein
MSSALTLPFPANYLKTLAQQIFENVAGYPIKIAILKVVGEEDSPPIFDDLTKPLTHSIAGSSSAKRLESRGAKNLSTKIKCFLFLNLPCNSFEFSRLGFAFAASC